MADNKFVLLCDSVSDLPQNWYDDESVRIIPHGLVSGGDEYWDDFVSSIPPHEVCRRMRAGESFTTLQGRLEDLLREFESAAASGRDALYTGFSSGLSGTFGTSVMAAQMIMEKYPERKMICVDCRGATMGLGIQAIEARRMRDEGMGIEAVAAEIEKRRSHACHFFTVDDLNHLYRGGRLSKSSALIGTLIGIKPVLYVGEDGKLTPLSKMRGRKASMQELVRLTQEHFEGDPAAQTFYINHGDVEEEANDLAQMLRETFPGVTVKVGQLSPTIVVHAGPGTLALFFWGTKRL